MQPPVAEKKGPETARRTFSRFFRQEAATQTKAPAREMASQVEKQIEDIAETEKKLSIPGTLAEMGKHILAGGFGWGMTIASIGALVASSAYLYLQSNPALFVAGTLAAGLLLYVPLVFGFKVGSHNASMLIDAFDHRRKSAILP